MLRAKQSLRRSGGSRKTNKTLVFGCFGGGGYFGGFGLASVGLGILAAETLDASGGVHQLLLAGEKWVAGGANFHADVALVGRTGHKCVAARAMHAHRSEEHTSE